MGIIVDDTVHFLSKYSRARNELKLSPEEAVKYTLKHVGFALIVTTIILIAGFLVLATSSFKQNQDMGLIASLIIGIALVIDLLLLPAILLEIESRFNRSKRTVNRIEQ